MAMGTKSAVDPRRRLDSLFKFSEVLKDAGMKRTRWILNITHTYKMQCTTIQRSEKLLRTDGAPSNVTGA